MVAKMSWFALIILLYSKTVVSKKNENSTANLEKTAWLSPAMVDCKKEIQLKNKKPTTA
jgi:hypothetical protein